MKKINTLLLLFLVGTLTIFAQENEKTKQILNSASFIFKGTVKSFTGFKKENDKNLYISYIISVKEIYKGQNSLNLGTVKLISIAPSNFSLGDDGVLLKTENEKHLTLYEKLNNTTDFVLTIGSRGVFVCNKSLEVEIENSTVNVTNQTILAPVCETNKCYFNLSKILKIDYRTDKITGEYSVRGFGKNFDTEEQFYNFLILSIPSLKKKDVKFLRQKEENRLIYNERVKNAKIREQLLEAHYQRSLKNQQTNKSNHDIEFKIANEQVTGASPQFYEFDIMVSGSGTHTTYLNNSAFVIEYNTTAFGQSIVSNTNVTITRGANYNTITYEDPMAGMTDDATNAISFIVGVDYNASSWNRPLLPSSQEQLAHVKIEVQDCNQSHDLQFINIVGTSFVALYTTTPNIDPNIAPFTSYDIVDYIQPLPTFICSPPVITNMFPSTISAGTNSLVTIEGFGFGNTRGSGQLELFDNNHGQTIIKHFDHTDYVSWSDTKIEFIVPSIIDTLPVVGTGRTPGSSVVRVRRNDGVKDVQGFPLYNLNINYANTNAIRGAGTSNFKKIRKRIVDDTPNNQDTLIPFYLHTSVANDAAMTNNIIKALEEWTCATLIRWEIKGDTNMVAQDANDGVNLIWLDVNNTNLGVRTLAQVQPYTNTCPIPGNEYYYNTGMDISIRVNFDSLTGTGWFFDQTLNSNVPPGLYDFFTIIEHELGHVHTLSHVNDTTDLMNPFSKPGPRNSLNRYDVFRSTNTIMGGSTILTESQTLTFCNGLSKMIPSNAQGCSVVGLDELFNKNSEIIAYPNPSYDILNLSFKLERNAIVNIKLYDYIGKEIKAINMGTQYIGKHNVKLDVSNYATGFYFLRVQIDNRIETVKLIIN